VYVAKVSKFVVGEGSDYKGRERRKKRGRETAPNNK
jgi:hypothetical protein